MADSMNVYTGRPHCWVDPAEHPPETLPPRQEWCWDQAAACGDAATNDSRARQFAHTPGCRGCSRRARAMMIEDGRAQAYPRKVSNPQPVPGAVAA